MLEITFARRNVNVLHECHRQPCCSCIVFVSISGQRAAWVRRVKVFSKKLSVFPLLIGVPDTHITWGERKRHAGTPPSVPRPVAASAPSQALSTKSLRSKRTHAPAKWRGRDTGGHPAPESPGAPSPDTPPVDTAVRWTLACGTGPLRYRAPKYLPSASFVCRRLIVSL